VRQDREGLAALLQVKGDAVGHGEFAEEIAECHALKETLEALLTLLTQGDKVPHHEKHISISIWGR